MQVTLLVWTVEHGGQRAGSSRLHVGVQSLLVLDKVRVRHFATEFDGLRVSGGEKWALGLNCRKWASD